MNGHGPIHDHKAWIGYLQPDGLVVSPAALVDAQAILSKDVGPMQQRYISLLGETESADGEAVPFISDFVAFAQNFLEWPDSCIYGHDVSRPVPEELKVPLPEIGETLSPTFAFREPQPRDTAKPWLLLGQVLPLGTDFDVALTGKEEGWSASVTRRFERLLRETGIPIGLLTNGTQIRLLYAPRGENAGNLTFPVSAMREVGGRPILSAFHLLLDRFRLLAAPSEARLSALLSRSREYQSRVSSALAEQVLDALYELVRGFQAADDRTRGELLKSVLSTKPDEVYGGLLTVLLRLVFLLYAEDRGMMPGTSLYSGHYSLHGLFERLRADDERHPDTMDHRFGAWAQLVAVFRVVHGGCRHPQLSMPPRSGHLFDPARYPFLEGADGKLPLVPDGVVYRVLRKLLVLDGERLSYRTLDVEQIGSVYETMMGFTLEVADGPSIALKPAKSKGAPTAVNLDQLLAVKPADRPKWLREHTDQKLTGDSESSLKAAETQDALLALLERRIARNATPQVVPNGAMLLQPTDERRRSGSHYTPRILTEPIVRTALRPVLERLGAKPTPEQILNLKICDPAVGSGAFLVEACRQLGDELVKAWHAYGQLPTIPPDEDEVLYARRRVAQRCLYGVDRNPMAADLAKLSLWLATLARDHPFTFLDHAIRTGDSLVGLSRQQIADFHWKSEPRRVLGQDYLERRIAGATAARKEILEADEELVGPDLKRQKLDTADNALSLVRFAGDCVIAGFFSVEKDRARLQKRDELLVHFNAYIEQQDLTADLAVKDLRNGPFSVRPFHWQVEFPEIFDQENGGFDVIVGNPPFLGGSRISQIAGMGYFQWLVMTYPPCQHHCDLVAYFFRKAFTLLRNGGCLGLLATNSIAQGDTREGGLRTILASQGQIYDARRRFKWPGEAAVVVSAVHISKGSTPIPARLDGRPVRRISAYLFDGTIDHSPARLKENPYFSLGSKIYGQGFLFADDDPDCTPIVERSRILIQHPDWEARIPPYLMGEEINSHPQQRPGRYVIYLSDVDQEEELAAWPELREIVATKVKPERLDLGSNPNNVPLKRRWWAYQAHRPELYNAIKRKARVLCISQMGQALAFAFIPTGLVFSHAVVVIDLDTYTSFAILQSRVHEVWARFLASSMKDDLRYTPSDCFETFPFPTLPQPNAVLEDIGRKYYELRDEIMLRENEGLTSIYNRFHDPDETSPKIVELREMHARMDRVVLDAYGWNELSASHEFILDYEEDDDDDGGRRRKKPWRYRWADSTRDEVISRLLRLNAERAEEERRAGAIESEAAAPAKRRRKKAVRDIRIDDLLDF